MKQCIKCDESKPLADFYEHPKSADGHMGRCKQCSKADATANRLANIDRVKSYDRRRKLNDDHRAKVKRYAKTTAGKERLRVGRVAWAAVNRDKVAAHALVNNALRSGRLEKKPCEVCGSTVRIHGHHDDYAKPLEVVWLCARHHIERHMALKQTQPAPPQVTPR